MGSLGLDVREVDGILTVDGARVALNLVARAHPTPADLRQLVEAATGHLPAVVVADRISEPGREELRRAGWGWLDRRGHLRVWTPGVRIESPVGAGRGAGRARGSRTRGPPSASRSRWPRSSTPAEQVTARRVAPRIGRSVGRHPRDHRPLRRGGAGGPDHQAAAAARAVLGGRRPTGPTTAGSRSPSSLEELAASVGPDILVRVDERAATLGGARIPAVGDLPARCYVPVRRRAAARAAPGRPRPTHPVLGPPGPGRLAAGERRAPARRRPPLAGRPPDRLRPAPRPRPRPRAGDRRRLGHRARRRRVTVVLSGRRDGSTHREVAMLASLPPELRLIGGLAVMCRVGTPHRTTVDVDAVARDLPQRPRRPRPAGRALARAAGSTASPVTSTST